MYAFFLGLKSISPAELHRLKQAEDITVVDVNARERWLEARVPGAKNLDPENFKARDLPAEKTETVVFYCSNLMCSKGPKAASRAKKLGFANAIVMSAGIKGWRDANLPVQSGEQA
jgi:rhodanese-related sulfurtransferase